MSCRSIFIVVYGLLSTTICLTANADIQYSWAGTIVPTGTNDPWFIGQQGQSFSLTGVVSSGANDFLSESLQFSAFNLTNAALVVGGQQVSYVGNGVIDFTDNSAGTFDVILMGGDFHWFGTTVEIQSAVALDPAVYAFTQPSEPLPIFPSTINVDRFACCGSPYTLIVEAGSALIVIPEPRGPLLPLIAAVLVTARRNNRYLLE